ncbi:hypothetical protein KDRO_B01240 [Kluyveromyces lactis]|nr:hypothetical protein KDRO_B01240 [Kluyveromyces lactis]
MSTTIRRLGFLRSVRRYSGTSGCADIGNNGKMSTENIRRVNLGCTITYLQSNVPHLLQTSLHEPRLSKDIELKIMPITHPYLPSFSGITKYYAVWNSIRFLLNTFVFSVENRVRIKSLNVEKDEVIMRWETHPLAADNLGSIKKAESETKISGIFIFGLNENCDKITSHLIDEVEIIEKDKKIDFSSKVQNGAIAYFKTWSGP